MFENITASEIAGYAVGALLLSATISATKIDGLISSSQRSSLKMCKRCGDLRMVACSKCNGFGTLKEGGPLDIIAVQPFGGGVTKLKFRKCPNCKSKGNFSCPECS